MYTLTKTESDILKSLVPSPLTEEEIIRALAGSNPALQETAVKNALEGCIVKGFILAVPGGRFKLTGNGETSGFSMF